MRRVAPRSRLAVDMVFAMAKPLIVLHPGYVRSRNDGDYHYVGVGALRRLYELRPGDHVIPERPGWGFCLPPNAVHLSPRDDGKYGRPAVLDGV